MYKSWWNSTIDESIMARFFLVYIFLVTIAYVEASHNLHCFFSLKGRLACTVQCAIFWYTWKRIVGLTLELQWSYSGLGISICVHFTQQLKTHFQFGKCIFLLFLCTHCCHFYVRCCRKHMLSMWRDRIFICLSVRRSGLWGPLA